MTIYQVAFIGYRKIDEQHHLEEPLDNIIKKQLQEKEFVELLVGCKGDFDILASVSAKMVQRAEGKQNSRLVLVKSCHTKDDDFYERFYDEVRYIELKSDHQSINFKQNQWMIDHADLVVFYVEPDLHSEAMKALKYAQKKGVKIINLAI